MADRTELPPVTVTAVGLRTAAGLNDREHHYARTRRVRAEKDAVYLALVAVPTKTAKALRTCSVVRTTLTRTGGRGLDDDNLAGALKGCRDAVAEWLERDDAPGKGTEWVYAEEPGGAWGVRITLVGIIIEGQDPPPPHVKKTPAKRPKTPRKTPKKWGGFWF